MNVLKRLRWGVDVAEGLRSGKYRAGYWRHEPQGVNENDNDHYLQSHESIKTNIEKAKSEGLPATSYPGFYWVNKFAGAVSVGGKKANIWDFGGAYGFDFFKLSRFLDYPFSYTVTEIPEIVERAKQLPELSQISFVAGSMPEQCPDILYSNGTTMNASKYLFPFIEHSRPKHIVISAVECSDEPTFYTIQTLRKTKRRCVYTTYNLKEFISLVERLGYRLDDCAKGSEQGSGVFIRRPLKVHYYSFAFTRTATAE